MNVFRHTALFASFALAGCAAQPDTRAADAAAIHALIKDWCAASQAKDVAGFAAVYADDAVVMLEAQPDMRGLANIRAGLGHMMQDPNFDLRFEADDVVVSRSGDLAYETGKYALAMTGEDGQPMRDNGHYVVVWRKQDGAWKVVIDAPISDPQE